MSKVKFKTHSKKKLAEFIWDLKNSFPEENLKERDNNPCIHIDFSEDLIKKILDSKKLNPVLKRKIVKEIKILDSEKKEIKEFIKGFEKFWRKEVEKIYFLEMKRIFGKKYLEKEYFCYPTKKVTGAYFGKNEITIIWNPLKKETKNKLNKNEFSAIVLAEEILHLIYWELWQEIYNREIKNIDEVFEIEGIKWSCWHVAEIIPEYILVQNNLFKRFNWDKDNRSRGYPWIPELKNTLDPIWKNSKDIKEFIIKAHKKLGINP